MKFLDLFRRRPDGRAIPLFDVDSTPGVDPQPRKLTFSQVQAIVDSEPVIRTYAACEFDELSEDGQVWLIAIANEVLARYGVLQPVAAEPPKPTEITRMMAGSDIRLGDPVCLQSIREGMATVIPAYEAVLSPVDKIKRGMEHLRAAMTLFREAGSLEALERVQVALASADAEGRRAHMTPERDALKGGDA